MDDFQKLSDEEGGTSDYCSLGQGNYCKLLTYNFNDQQSERDMEITGFSKFK